MKPSPASRLLIAVMLLGLGSACDSAGGTSEHPVTVAPPGDSTTWRALAEGPISGVDNAAGGHSWLGLPYASPPVGALRWRKPEAAPPWQERRVGDRPGSPCIQIGSPLGGVGKAGSQQGNEDCLYLNVYAPALQTNELESATLPVMVWVHGGGNTVGHAAFYDGAVLAARERVLVVMVNYRLGPFGWLVPPDPRDDQEASGNFGNLDVLEALRWVQRNARAFGGDPQNVTVFGESAGATNAFALLFMPAAQGLYQRLILQSLGFGFAPLPEASAVGHAHELWRRLAGESSSAPLTPDELGQRLRALDPWAIYSAYRNGDRRLAPPRTVFQDGALIPLGSIDELLTAPTTPTDIPILLGTNRDEPKVFMAFDPRHVRQAFGLPVALRDAAAYDREARYRSLLWKADGVDSIARSLTARGATIYAYRWDWDEQGKAYGLIDLSRILGAAHGLEIPFVLGNFDVGPQSGLIFTSRNAAGRELLSRRMMNYFASFARSGNPGDANALTWTPWRNEADQPRLLIFDTETDGGLRMVDLEVTRERVEAEMDADPALQGRRLTR